MKKQKKKKINKNKGITLVALIVTIVIMLILAGTTINVIVDGGVFRHAQNAKNSVENVQHIEKINTAIISAKAKEKSGKLTAENLQKEIDKITDLKNFKALKNGENIVLKANDSNIYYLINNKGTVEGPQYFEVDEMAGDITKGGKLNGTEAKPFEINYIEDLVVFSIMTNGGNSNLGIASKTFSGEYVVLKKSLDFESIFSYNDYENKEYGDLNKDGTIEDIRTELTKREGESIGFVPINNFLGIFDGKGNTIENIYQKNTETKKTLGLFINANVIQNLKLTGTIINTTWGAGGFVGDSIKVINGCENYANITGYNMVGGIVSRVSSGEIKNCKNFGNISITGKTYQYGGAGGITGYIEGNKTIEGCSNEGKIEGNTSIAGIVGVSNGGNIISCYNKGESNAGIIDWVRAGKTNVVNCYNLGECKNGLVNNFSGANWADTIELNIKNCYNLGNVKNAGIIGTQGTTSEQITLNMENVYNSSNGLKAILGTRATNSKTTSITNINNTYYEQNKIKSAGAITEGIIALDEVEIKNNTGFIETLNGNIGDNIGWKRWEIGTDGWPTFK